MDMNTGNDFGYTDYSTYQVKDEEKRRGRIIFPQKLHAIVSDPDYQDIICWMPHGRSWRVLDKDRLASVVCYEQFKHNSFTSFKRSVNGWGFKVSLLLGCTQHTDQ